MQMSQHEVLINILFFLLLVLILSQCWISAALLHVPSLSCSVLKSEMW